MAENLRFDGRVVIVTGAGGGLGRSHALAFGARGASVVVNDLGASHTGEGASSRAADVVVEEIRAAGGKAVANYDSVLDGEKIVETAMKAFGRVDIIINNAGILKDVSFARMTDQQWDLIFQVHVDGAYKVLKAAWPIFRKQKFGRIINTTSAAGLYGNFGQANYSAAKLALVGLTQTLALEGKRDNIHCNVIAPMAASRMTETVLPPDMLASLKPEMVTPLVEYLCHENTTETGSIFEVGAGFVGKLRWERTGGHGFPIDKSLLPEHVQEMWSKITDFEDGRSTHPTTTAESMEGIMANFENVGGDAARPKVVSEDGKVDVEAAKSLSFEPETFEYSERDVILYNLGIGATRKDLHLVYENNEAFGAVPTFGVIPSFTAMNAVPFGDILPSFNPMMLLHGEQYLEIIKPFPTSGKLISTPYVVDILDKGKGCVATIGVKTTDENGDDICVNEFTMFIRGSGNFGGKKEGADRGAATAVNQVPKRKPDHVVQEKTSEDQAALYRLSGDWNPLHIDPDMAAVGGFDVPILHGLCSFGIAGKHIFKTYCDNNAASFKNIKVRFAKTVNPGETLETSMWREGNKVIFQVRAVERDAIIISNAAVELQGEALKAAAPAAAAAAPAAAPAAAGNFKSAAAFDQIKTGIEAMTAADREAQVKKVKAIFQFELTNDEGKTATYHIDLKNGAGAVGAGPSKTKADAVISTKDDVFVDLASGKANAQKLFMSGQIKVKGQVMLATKLGDVLKANKSKL
ncbi:hypothetical protein BGZ67_006882 [Mortierella alpina]|nr:hypothetical protein BGZ67_006882 [Mortierella alpina]